MKTSPLLLLAVGASLFLACAPARGEEKETPADTPRTENRSDRDTAKKEKPPRSAPDKPTRRTERNPSPRSAEKRTWIGISTAPMDYALREHLEIAEGFGIQVIEVMPDSPASAAGLRSNDIILRFEDQRIISPEHLSLLVRAEKSGEKATLSLIRKGQAESVELTLGETDAARFPHRPGFGPRPPYPGHHEDLRRRQEHWRDWMYRNRPEWRGPSSREERDRESRGEDAKESDSARPREGRPPAVSVNPGFPLRVFGTEGVLKIDNEQGELTLTREDEKHTLQLKNAEGEIVYDGPFDPGTGVAGLPREARDHLETMKLGNFEIRLPESPKKESEEKPTSPEEEPDDAPESGIL
ncbi:MAG: PDZ domain-containing protein [Verrucomicrobiaceae bacterium]|nr:PDZ domain-containing protein [Verrucomicrobiaceae bacterium]